MITTPPYLQKGDTIGIVCPSGAMTVEKASECIRVLNEEWEDTFRRWYPAFRPEGQPAKKAA